MKYRASFLFLTCCAASGLLVLYLLVTSMPFNPVRSRYAIFTKSGINQVMPEGWGFFTRAPRGPRLVLYNSRMQRVIFNTAAPSVYFGLSRYHRILSSKMSIASEELKKDTMIWKKFSGRIDSSIVYLPEQKIPITNSSLCGIYYLQLIEPLPWSWDGIKDEWDMPSSVCKINLVCAN